MSNGIYWSIALLAVGGDLLKRFLHGQTALGILYGAAILILVVMWVGQTRRTEGEWTADGGGRLAVTSTLIVIGTYLLQFLTTFDAPLLDGFNHMLYMGVPLAYIVVVHKAGPRFSLEALAHAFLVLMIPVNVVGLIQYFIDPNFFISTAYSGPLGGAVERNLLGEAGGFFTRFPSVFASADRYSAMGLMQFVLALVLLSGRRPLSRWGYAWIAVNLASSFMALGVAGARSRILLVMLEMTLLAAVYLYGVLTTAARSSRDVMKAVGVGMSVFAFLVYYFGEQDSPIFVFLEQSFDEGDIEDRVELAWQVSRLHDDVSWFGAGLGTIGGGKPGEFGINAMWQESGLVWGTLLLAGFAGLLAVLARRCVEHAFAGHALELVIASLPLLVIVTGLFTGLTSAFELSSGILLACVTAVALHAEGAHIDSAADAAARHAEGWTPGYGPSLQRYGRLRPPS